MAASRDRAPERTLTAVRAIAAVAGMPPNSGVTRLAMPLAEQLSVGVVASPTLMPSATVADIRLSSAASAATAIAGTSKLPTVPAGSAAGSASGACQGSRRSSRRDVGDGRDTVAATMARSETGIPGGRGQRAAMTATTEPETASGARFGAASHARPHPPRRPGRQGAVDRDAQRRRHLLEGDDHGDPDREALDDRQRDVAHITAGAGVARADEQDARHDAHDEDTVHAELRDDRDEHDRHRSRRAADLEIRPAEQRREYRRRRSL